MSTEKVVPAEFRPAVESLPLHLGLWLDLPMSADGRQEFSSGEIEFIESLVFGVLSLITPEKIGDDKKWSIRKIERKMRGLARSRDWDFPDKHLDFACSFVVRDLANKGILVSKRGDRLRGEINHKYKFRFNPQKEAFAYVYEQLATLGEVIGVDSLEVKSYRKIAREMQAP